MSLGHGASIVRNGLVLHLDAANPKSYPGSGTAWKDLSGLGNNGTLVNGVGYSSSNSGSLVFDGSNDYGTVIGTAHTKPTGTFTVSFWLKPTSVSFSNCRILGDWYQASTLDRWIFYANGSSVQWYMRTSTFGEGGTPAYTMAPNTWKYFSGIYDGSFQKFFVDGVFFSQRAITGTLNPGNYGNPDISFGQQRGLGGAFNGNIANIHMHSRALSAAEVRQNFEATRSRYGV